MNCFRGRSLVFAVRGAAHQSDGLLFGSGRDYWAFRQLHMVSHSPSDQRGTRLSPHLTPGARDFTGISTQSCLISPSTLFLLMAISNMNAHTLALTLRNMVKCKGNEIKIKNIRKNNQLIVQETKWTLLKGNCPVNYTNINWIQFSAVGCLKHLKEMVQHVGKYVRLEAGGSSKPGSVQNERNTPNNIYEAY